MDSDPNPKPPPEAAGKWVNECLEHGEGQTGECFHPAPEKECCPTCRKGCPDNPGCMTSYCPCHTAKPDAVEEKIIQVLNAEREWLRDRLEYRLRELVDLAKLEAKNEIRN